MAKARDRERAIADEDHLPIWIPSPDQADEPLRVIGDPAMRFAERLA
jgi:hypothetical protein